MKAEPIVRRAVELGVIFFDTTNIYSNSVIEAVTALTAERGLPPARIALAWLLHKPGVTALLGRFKIACGAWRGCL